QAGIYTFIITDNNTNSSNCEIIVTQELDFPVSPVIDEVHVTNVSCNAGSDGVLIITLAPTSDTDPKYTYELYAFPSETQIGFARTTPEFDGLAAGEYRVRVKSARACFDDRIVRVEEPDPLTATATSTPFTCNVNNDVSMSTITLTGDGGTKPYKYKFENGGFSSSNTFNVFDIGSDQTINYWVRDANGCVVPGTIEIQPLNTFELNLSEDT